ncbi:putative gustatory receptor 98b [Teleopsis dalmanni]|uniref:putative gustatory receptor 98b n=1 Tax=Teleopsis dalmanni TaxID=139649 RepID=UPI0018CDB12E|nr:putative gustatory receptor 98b [Teleopsis dalmanni]
MHNNDESNDAANASKFNSFILSALEPYQWCFAYFGLMAPPPFFSSNKQTKCKTILQRLLYVMYSLVLLSITICATYINNAYISDDIAKDDLDVITAILDIGQSISVTVIQMILQMTALLGYRQLCNFLVAIVKLEEEIQWHCNMLAATDRQSKRRYSLRRRLALHTGILIVFLFIVMPRVQFALLIKTMPFIYKMFTVFSGIMIQIGSVQFCVFVEVIHEMLLQLEENMLLLRHEFVKPADGNVSLQKMLYESLQANQNLLARVWHLVGTIERYYSLPMFVLLFNNSLVILHISNWIYLDSSEPFNYYQGGFIAIMILNMLVPCWLSQICINTYNRFGTLLHNLRTDDLDIVLSMRLKEYSLQLMHQKIVFSCGGFFDFNLRNFGALLLTIIMYIVIMIQFKLQSDPNASTKQSR